MFIINWNKTSCLKEIKHYKPPLIISANLSNKIVSSENQMEVSLMPVQYKIALTISHNELDLQNFEIQYSKDINHKLAFTV